MSLAALILATAVTTGLEESRPCGPDSMPPVLRLFIPQGFLGADFRGSCRAHDNCYDHPNASKESCDGRFLASMQCACKDSLTPRLCKVVARGMHMGVTLGGKGAFSKSR